jgi:hypothetical protein
MVNVDATDHLACLALYTFNNGNKYVLIKAKVGKRSLEEEEKKNIELFLSYYSYWVRN